MSAESPFDPFVPPEFRVPPLAATIMEAADQPGIAAALATAATGALEQWPEHIAPTGDLQLGTFDGISVRVRRTEIIDETVTPYIPKSPTESAKVAASGIAAWFRRRLRQPAQRGTPSYAVLMEDAAERTEITAVTLGNGGIHTYAERTSQTHEGPVTSYLEGDDLTTALTQATAALQDGFPLSVEADIAARQAGPSERIIGQEAAGVQRVVEGVLGSTAGLGDRSAALQRAVYGTLIPQFTGEWAVLGIEIMKRAGTVAPNMEGASGRSVLSTIRFDSIISTIGAMPYTDTSLVVKVEGVYGDGDRLVGAEVHYYREDADGEQRRAAFSQEQRADVYHAIVQQLSADNLMRLD